MIDQKRLKGSLPVLIGLFTLLFFGAVVFFKPRFLFADDAHILFRIINEGSFQIPGKRYGSFISQLIPLLASLSLLPLWFLMLLYSVSFILFYVIVLLLLVCTFKRYDLAILLGFCLTLFVSGTFYWPYNEMPQGVAWLLLGFAWAEHMIMRKKAFILSLLLFFLFFSLAIWSHPLLIIIAAYLFVFSLINGALRELNKIKIATLIATVAIAVLFRSYYMAQDNYDSNILSPLLKLHVSDIPGVFLNPHSVAFSKHCLNYYWAFTIVLCCGIYGMIRAKNYLSIIFSLAFFFGFLFIVSATYPGAEDSFFLESEYVPFIAFASIPFIYFFLPLLQAWKVPVLLGSLFLVRVIYILYAAPEFLNRVDLLQSLLDKMQKLNYNKAVFVDDQRVLNDKMKMTWGNPEESIMLSALRGEHPQRTFVTVTSSELKGMGLPGRDTLLGCFEKRPYSRLNRHYFRMDTIDTYHIIEMSPKKKDNYKEIYPSSFSKEVIFNLDDQNVIAIWGNTPVRSNSIFLDSGKYSISIVTKGSAARKVYPHINVFEDSSKIGDYFAPASYQTVEFYFEQGKAGSIVISFAMDNDYTDPATHEDRNAFVQYIYLNKVNAGTH